MSERGLTRRTLLTRAGATGLAALGAPAILAACASPQAAPQTSAPAGAATAGAAPTATGKLGGRITYAVLAEGAAGLDPHAQGAYTAVQFVYRVYDQLVTLDANGRVSPSLATSWSQSSPTRWTFKIRDDVKFSSGRPMTSADVAKSLLRYKQSGISYPSLPAPMQDVKALDDRTVQVDLAEPYGPFPTTLAWGPVAILPMQELEAGTFDPKKEMLGTGPFVVKQVL